MEKEEDELQSENREKETPELFLLPYNATSAGMDFAASCEVVNM